MIKKTPLRKVNSISKFKSKAKAVKKTASSTFNSYPISFFSTFVRPLIRNVQQDYTDHELELADEFKMHLEFADVEKFSLFEEQMPLNFSRAPKELLNVSLENSVSLIHSSHNASPFSYLLLFLKKAYLRQEARKTLWKGRSGEGKQLRRFGQISLSRNLPQFYQRIIKLPASRLHFFYMFDVLVLWIYFFFRKVGRLLKLFFYEQWCNLYFFFSLRENTNFSLKYAPSFKFLYSTWFSNYFEKLIFTCKIEIVSLQFSGPGIYSFINVFKLMCLFWNKRKQKHVAFRIFSRRWQKQYSFLKSSGLMKKYVPFWKKIKTTRFFVPSKILRLKFRRQHGSKLLMDYPLRVQLRKLKPKTRPKFSKTYCSPRPVLQLASPWLISDSLVDGKILKPKKVYFLNNYVRLFLENRRRIFLRNFIASTLGKVFVQTDDNNAIDREMVFLKRFCKKWYEFSPSSFIKILLHYFKHLRSKRPVAVKNKSHVSLERLIPLFYGHKIWANILFVVLKHLSGVKNSVNLTLPLNKYNRVKPSFLLKQKLTQRLNLVDLSFAQLYKDFAKHKIKARRFFNFKQGAKNRKLVAGLKRRKLLLAIKFKTLLPKEQRAPLFCFSINKKTFGGF